MTSRTARPDVPKRGGYTSQGAHGSFASFNSGGRGGPKGVRVGLGDQTPVRLLELLLLVVVCGSITFSVAYNNYESFSRELETAAPPGDTADYLRAYLQPGDMLSGAGVAYRDYRLVAPLLAHLIPDPPVIIFRSARRMDAIGLGVFKFATVTALFNFATCVLVYVVCRQFQLSRLSSLLGACLYSTLTFVLLVNGIPHVDSVFFFVFGLGAYAVLKRNIGLIVVTALVGTFVKEAIFLLGILALLLPERVAFRGKLVAAMVPGAALYVIVRYALVPSTRDYFSSGQVVPLIGVALRNLATLNGVEWVFMGFNFLWLPIVWAVLRGAADPTLARWALFIPILVLVTVLGGSDHFGRSLPLAFPVAMPLAMLGIQALIDRIEARAEQRLPGPSARTEHKGQLPNPLTASERGLSAEVP